VHCHGFLFVFMTVSVTKLAQFKPQKYRKRK